MTPFEIKVKEEKQKELEQLELLRSTFEEWRKHPGTTLILRALNEKKEQHIQQGVFSVSARDIPDSEFRRILTNVQAYQGIINLMTDFETFKGQVKQ